MHLLFISVFPTSCLDAAHCHLSVALCPGVQELIESIGQEKAKVDEEVEKGREDEEAAAALQNEVTAFQEECSNDLAAAEPIIQVCSCGRAWSCA